MIRKSPVSAFLVTSSTCRGPADSVLAFWKSLNFGVAYDVIKDATVGTCHSQGFAVSTKWSHVRLSAAVHTQRSVKLRINNNPTMACRCGTSGADH